MSNKKTPNVLVFSIGLNGYEHLYRNNFETHQCYARMHGYHYVCVQKPSYTTLGMECAWLKVTLMIRALHKGYHWVVFLDADTQVNSDTPPITALEAEDKSLYVARGYSGRFNSGVLIVKNCHQVLRYFERVLAHAEMPLPSEDDVGWGENGHLIYFSKYRHFVHYLDQRWNNNAAPDLDDYIRHYSYGPLRELYRPGIGDKIAYWVCHYKLALLKRLELWQQRLCGKKRLGFNTRLALLVEQVIQAYPVFSIGSDTVDSYQDSTSLKQRLPLRILQQNRPARRIHLKTMGG